MTGADIVGWLSSCRHAATDSLLNSSTCSGLGTNREKHKRVSESQLTYVQANQASTSRCFCLCSCSSFCRRVRCPFPDAADAHRYGKLEHVVVVARNGDEVIYWQDGEEVLTIRRGCPNFVFHFLFCVSCSRSKIMRSKAWGRLSRAE